MVDFVLGGRYIGYFIEEQMANTDLVKLELSDNLPINPIVMIYSKYSSDIVKEFVKLVLVEN